MEVRIFSCALICLMNFYTYILRSSKTGNYYKGHSANLKERLKQHNSGKTKSTKNGAPWSLVYFEVFSLRLEAIAREKYFKTAAGRRFIKSLNLESVVEVPCPTDFVV